MKPDCIIAAREGSKRIKNKNIVIFKNKPLIYYGIKTAIKSRIFENVYVYTDSKKIAKIAVRYGAKVPFMRPKYLSDDKTGLKEVIVSVNGDEEKGLDSILSEGDEVLIFTVMSGG